MRKFQIGLRPLPTTGSTGNSAGVPAPTYAVPIGEFPTTAGAIQADDADMVLVAALSAWPPCGGSIGMNGGMSSGMVCVFRW